MGEDGLIHHYSSGAGNHIIVEMPGDPDRGAHPPEPPPGLYASPEEHPNWRSESVRMVITLAAVVGIAIAAAVALYFIALP